MAEADETFPGSGLCREEIEGLGSRLARRVETHEALDSTQRRARELAREGAPHGTLVVCGVQTGGRGRQGRWWGSPAGGLWMSAVLRPGFAATLASRVTQTAAVGVAKALWELGVEARIKWPNDLLVETGGGGRGRKICGILAESSVEDAPADPEQTGARGERRVEYILLGIGLNANLDPADLGVEDGEVATVSSELGREVPLREILAKILYCLEYELSRLEEGFGDILDDWRSLDCTLGERVRVQSLGRDMEGRALDLTPGGALVMRTRSGDVEVFEGEVERLRRET